MSADEQGYNGWTNYETWAVGMYLDGNYTGEGTYHEVLRIVVDVVETPNYNANPDESFLGSPALSQRAQLADALKDYVQEATEVEDISGLLRDLLRAALGDVNWRELAEAKLAEITEA